MQVFADKIFENPIKIIEAFDNKSFLEAFSQIETLRKSHYLLGYIRYEAKEIFLGKNIESKYPLLYFEVFDKNAKMQRCIEAKKNSSQLTVHSSLINYQTYENAIKQIKEEIACGNTYQVNYTYDYKIETNLDGFELYKSILPRQTTPYNAYIKNKYEEILSFSPELFFELEGVNGGVNVNKIKTKPMKGTVKRGKTEEEDRENIEFLKNDIKNRAENVMIVDLLRNDLGKVAKTGTVTVDKLFEVETHRTVHQMTSEISAELEDNTTLYGIFEAIFPCGSVTGTPKINTMEIIGELEIGNRNIYCGAIGLISPEKTVFSVPIRILQKKNNEDFFFCRVGGAVVWDSTPEDEWEETLTKIKFLGANERVNVMANISDYKLVETMVIENSEIKYKEGHLQRMKKSADELGFKFNAEMFDIKFCSDCMLRLLLNKDGAFETQILPINEIKTNRIIISEESVNSEEAFLYHKTTHRPWYKKSMEKIKSGEIFDEIFFNEKGELTEGSRSNVVLQFGDKLFTPPVECGLLNGILRQNLIDEGKVKEKILYRDDLEKADKIFCINSVRGMVETPLSSLVSENCV